MTNAKMESDKAIASSSKLQSHLTNSATKAPPPSSNANTTISNSNNNTKLTNTTTTTTTNVNRVSLHNNALLHNTDSVLAKATQESERVVRE